MPPNQNKIWLAPTFLTQNIFGTIQLIGQNNYNNNNGHKRVPTWPVPQSAILRIMFIHVKGIKTKFKSNLKHFLKKNTDMKTFRLAQHTIETHTHKKPKMHEHH